MEKKVALALLDEVAREVESNLGKQIAMPFDVDNYDAKRDIFCKEMVKQCELAVKKASEDNEVLLRSYILRAQLCGCWQKPMGVRGTHNDAEEFYEKSLRMPGVDEAIVRYRYALFCRVSPGRKQKAIDNFKRVIVLAGENSELGIECSKELAKEQEKKGGCFIATACYGTDNTPEVLTLRAFRDSVLLSSKTGRAFVKLYYWISPPIANQIAKRDWLQEITRTVLIIPLVKFAINLMKKKQ